MDEVRLVLDAGANEVADQAQGIAVAPLTISFSNQSFRDDGNMDMSAFMTAMKQTTVAGRSSCPSIQDWLDALAGSKRAVIVAMTSALSGSYSSAYQAKVMYEEAHPEAKVIVVDSRSAGPEPSIVLHGIQALLAAGVNWGVLEAKISEMRTHTHLVFVLQSLRNLALNGRISKAVAKVAGILKINVVGTANREGKFELLSKVHGMKRALRELKQQMLTFGYQGGEVIIDHCHNLRDAELLQGVLTDEFPAAKVTIRPMRAICSFYAEEGGLMVGFIE